MPNSTPLEVVIVGGGPAGLGAALVLGRCLRRVLVCDTGEPRNAPARVFNGYLSRDGSTPGEFLQICREQLARYETVELRHAKVTGAQRNEEGFTVTLENGADSLAGVRFTDGSFLPRTVHFFSPGQHQKPSLAAQLGCELCPEDGCIHCDEKAATSVPGVYAAGNASGGVQMVIAAPAEGALAAEEGRL